MNSRERILATIRRQPADRVPCSPHIAVGTIEQMPEEDWLALRRHTDVTMSVGALGDEEIFGGQHWLDQRQIERQGDETRTTVETPLGPLCARRVKTREASWVAEHYYKGQRDIERVLSVPYTFPEFSVSPYHDWERELGDDGLVALGIPSAFRFCLGFFGSQNLYYKLADAPEQVETLVETMNERLALYVRACCERGVRSFWMGGSEHCGPGVVHPRTFRRLITPYDKAIVDIIHEYDGIVNYHTHGKLHDILDEIAEIGVDVMSPIETGLRGDVTLAEVKARVGDRICLKGNLDDMAFLALASEEEVREAAQDCLEQAAAGGGYILSGTDAGIYSPEWVQSFLVMAEVAHKYRYT